MRRAPALVLAAVVLLLPGCTFFEAWTEEQPPGGSEADGLSVVPDDEPFDPSKALKDEGEGELEKAAQENGEPKEKEEKKESLITEGEAQARRKQSEQQVEQIDESQVEDDEAKTRVASNPPPEDPGSGERWTEATLDYAMEIAAILVLSLVLATPIWLLLRAVR